MLLLALACAGPSEDTGDSTETPIPWSYPLDDVLRVSDAHVVATHNSYHVAPDPYVVPDWDYTMPPLAEQLDAGVRSLELDIHQHAGGDTFRVYHVETFDETSTCDTLPACLAEIAAWSDRNPAHFPVFVQIEPKDDTGGDPITDYDGLDAALRAAFPDVFTPAELRGDHATLAAALAADGWPTLGALRGRVFFGLDDGEAHRAAYRARGEGVVFVDALPGEDDGALAILNDPGDPHLAQALAAGMLVRVFADSATDTADERASGRDAALASGAHFLSSDFPVDTSAGEAFRIPEGAPVGCNPVTAPAECTAAALEDPTFVRY
jgi:hypothetical protein